MIVVWTDNLVKVVGQLSIRWTEVGKEEEEFMDKRFLMKEIKGFYFKQKGARHFAISKKLTSHLQTTKIKK